MMRRSIFGLLWGMYVHARRSPLETLHYENMSVQYTAIFHGCKNYNFQMNIFDIFPILLKT